MSPKFSEFLILVFETDTTPLEEIFDLGPLPPKQRREDASPAPRECRNGLAGTATTCHDDAAQPEPFGDNPAGSMLFIGKNRLSRFCA